MWQGIENNQDRGGAGYVIEPFIFWNWSDIANYSSSNVNWGKSSISCFQSCLQQQSESKVYNKHLYLYPWLWHWWHLNGIDFSMMRRQHEDYCANHHHRIFHVRPAMHHPCEFHRVDERHQQTFLYKGHIHEQYFLVSSVYHPSTVNDHCLDIINSNIGYTFGHVNWFSSLAMKWFLVRSRLVENSNVLSCILEWLLRRPKFHHGP